MQEGDYTYQLTVTDTAGQQATAQVTVIVQPGKLLPWILPGLGPLGQRGRWQAVIPQSLRTTAFPFALLFFLSASVCALPLLVTV